MRTHRQVGSLLVQSALSELSAPSASLSLLLLLLLPRWRPWGRPPDYFKIRCSSVRLVGPGPDESDAEREGRGRIQGDRGIVRRALRDAVGPIRKDGEQTKDTNKGAQIALLAPLASLAWSGTFFFSSFFFGGGTSHGVSFVVRWRRHGGMES